VEPFGHQSVLPTEVLHYLAPRPGGVYVDGTLGGGGHSELILEALGLDGVLYGIDRDPAALAAATKRLSRFGDRFQPLQGSFGDLTELLAARGVSEIDGLLLDLGVSSPQLDRPERGFSFRADGPLDMRMDPTQGETAADLVNSLSERELELAIKEYGEERWARKIAQRIVTARQEQPITTTLQLAALVERTIPRRFQEDRIHPATRTFQGLRILVNGELEQVEQGLQAGIGLLKPGGRVVVISFHSLEDRIVKQGLRDAATGCRCPRQLPQCVCGQVPLVRVLTGRPVTAGAVELADNPRSRSAKLRAAERVVS
jgi:16S rRNA (cytosine1402-N4)-methyltransferase